MTSPLVTAEWLRDNLDRVVVLDASYHLPGIDRDQVAEFESCHIPGAARFDIDAIADPTNPLPHMVPDADDFITAIRALGINNTDHVIFYDDSDVKPAARGWWMMRLFGHEKVSILDGGLAAWHAIEGPVEAGSAATRAPGDFVASPARGVGVTDFTALVSQIGSDTADQVLDARAAARFAGAAPEPRKGLRAGHIPGSCNLPFTKLLDENGKFRPRDDLERLFIDAGMDMSRPVITSCGSGVTACVLAIGLTLAGHESISVYDGSWTEWGASNAPIETGPAETA